MGKDAANNHPKPDRPRKPRVRPRSRLFALLSVVVLAAIWLWALAWLAGGVSWCADLLANLAMQGLLIAVAAAGVWLLARRRVLFTLALLACLMHVWIISTGRACLMPRGFEPTGRIPGAVRLFHYNASHKRPPDEVLAVLASASPDVASIAEPSVTLQTMVMYGDGLSDQYPYRLRRMYRERGPADRVGAGVVLSRWPLEPYPTDDVVAEGIIEDVLAGVLTVPAAAIGATTDQRWGLIAIHPRSPRTAERWAHGNEVVRATAAVSKKMQAEGLPVVVLADLNSTPSGWRSRELFFEGGLRRAKPLLAPVGTYPSLVEFGQHSFRGMWPGTIAIDDAFVSPGLYVRGWTRLDPAESDHWPVLTELVPTKR